MRIIPPNRIFIRIELTLVLGLCEAYLIDVILRLPYTRSLKSLILMAGTAGIFALIASIVEPFVKGTLKQVAKADQGSSLSRLVIHASVFLALFYGYYMIFAA
jgi:hypothetical protein